MSTIAAIAAGDARFNVLVNALTYVDAEVPGSNLLATLSDSTVDLTVFAPTDAAFAQLAADLGYTGAADDEGAVTSFLVGALPAETIRDVILYHVSAGSQTLAQIAANPTVATLNGATFTADGPTLVDNEPDIIDPALILTDIGADNGIVHVIDRVLLPFDVPGNDVPTIAGIVAASGGTPDTNSGDFDILLTAVQTAGLVDALNDASADLTAFAPTDAAFLQLAQDLGYTGTNEARVFPYLADALTLLSGGGNPVPLLTDVLLYHVAGESLQAAQVIAEGSVTTLLGPDLTLDGTSLVDADDDIANPNLIATDIQAANGVVHVIDGVLLPVDIDFDANEDLLIDGARSSLINVGAGDDLVDGNSGADTILGGRGEDLILGGAGADSLIGGANEDTLMGERGADKLSGGFGDDVLAGGGGRDQLTGGQGEDTFVFTEHGGRDTIHDFRVDEDTIDISAFGFADFADLRSHITSDLSGSLIRLGEGTSIFLEGVAKSQLSGEDFIFA